MAKRSLFSVSLRALLLFVTLVCVGIWVFLLVYEERYGRNYRAHQYFTATLPHLDARFGDACPKDFIFFLDGRGRKDGTLPTMATPDWLDRLAGRPLSHPPLRELSFRTTFQGNNQFTSEIVDQIALLAPELEYLELPYLDNLDDSARRTVVESMIRKASELKELRVLSFDGWPITDAHIEVICGMEQLQVLQMAATRIKPEVTSASLNCIKHLPHLRALSISSKALRPEDAELFHDARPEVVASINGKWYGDPQRIYSIRNRGK